MEKILITATKFAMLFILLFIITNANALQVPGKIFLLKLSYDNGSLNSIDVLVKDGFAPDRKLQPEQGWTAEVVSFKGDILESFKFQVPNTLFLAPPLEGQQPGGPIVLDKVNFTLMIQYYNDAKSIEVYNETMAKILSADVSKFATCNLNGICESGESYVTCPTDCRPLSDFIWLIVAVCAIIAIAAISIKLQKKSIRLQKS